MTHETADDDVVENDSAVEREDASPGSEDPRLRTLREERDELRDLLLRKQAEFENFRKRTERERAEFVQFALADSMKELIEVLDSFELALRDHGSLDSASQNIHRGYELIYKQLLESMHRVGLESIDAQGVRFDPHLHQAVSTAPSAQVEEGHVLAELRKGYLLKGRLLRPAMVTVASGPAPGRAEGAE